MEHSLNTRERGRAPTFHHSIPSVRCRRGVLRARSSILNATINYLRNACHRCQSCRHCVCVYAGCERAMERERKDNEYSLLRIHSNQSCESFTRKNCEIVLRVHSISFNLELLQAQIALGSTHSMRWPHQVRNDHERRRLGISCKAFCENLYIHSALARLFASLCGFRFALLTASRCNAT